MNKMYTGLSKIDSVSKCSQSKDSGHSWDEHHLFRTVSWMESCWKINGSNGYSKEKIFREINDEFIFVHETELGRCADQIPMLSEGFYSCLLPGEDRLLVQERDIIGIYLPHLSQTRFEINFTTSPTNQINWYIYSEDVTGSVNVSGTAMAKNTPQLNLDIVANVPTPTQAM